MFETHNKRGRGAIYMNFKALLFAVIAFAFLAISSSGFGQGTVSETESFEPEDGWVPPSVKNDARYYNFLCNQYKKENLDKSCPKSISDLEIWKGTEVKERNKYSNVVAVIVDIHSQDGTIIDNQLCSGVLIAKDEVLTARHCLEHSGEGNYSSIYQVVFGLHYQAENDPDQDPDNDRVRVSSCRPYPASNFVACNSISPRKEKEKRDQEYLDLLILKLNHSVEIVSEDVNVEPISLLDTEQYKASNSGTIVGFGVTENPDEYGNLREAEVALISKYCKETLDGQSDSERYDCIENSEIVAGGNLNPILVEGDACTGDSGGPLLVKYQDKYLLAGITSRAVKRKAENTTSPFCGFGGVYVVTTKEKLANWLAYE